MILPSIEPRVPVAAIDDEHGAVQGLANSGIHTVCVELAGRVNIGDSLGKESLMLTPIDDLSLFADDFLELARGFGLRRGEDGLLEGVVVVTFAGLQDRTTRQKCFRDSVLKSCEKRKGR